MHDKCQETSDGNGIGNGICSNVMEQADWTVVVVVIVLVMMVVMISMSLEQMLYVLIGYPDDNHQHQDDNNTFHVEYTYVSSPSTGWSGFVVCGVVVA